MPYLSLNILFLILLISVSPIAYYYVINGSVHQAPDMYSLVQSRLLGALEPLRNAFGEVTNYSRYNTAKGYYWEFKNKPNVKKREEEKVYKLNLLFTLNNIFIERGRRREIGR